MCTYIYIKKITDCLIYCILSNGEVIKYHKFISVVVIELSVRCLNTGPEDRLTESLCSSMKIDQSVKRFGSRSGPMICHTVYFDTQNVSYMSHGMRFPTIAVCATSKASDQPGHTHSLIRAFASRLILL